jgi:RND family efflux transporter MFP subunit
MSDPNANANQLPGGEGHLDADVQKPSKRSIGTVGIVAILIFCGLGAAGIVPRLRAHAEDKEDAQKAASESAHVVAVHPSKAGDVGDLPLPGSIQPIQESVIYARTSGYLHKYFHDIGDHVKEGELLATIDTPEVDQELVQVQAAANQSKAMVVQAQTNRELAQTTLKRYGALAPSGVASQQELDERQAAFDAQQANLQAAQAAQGSSNANVARLSDLKGFAKVYAPFDGVVTARTTEIGQLVTAGSAQGQALFKVAQLDTVRVFVHVPQTYAPSVKVGSVAKVTVREIPGRVFLAKVTRTANELDSLARTLLTQVDIPNGDNALLAGMYADVALDVKRAGQTLLIPSTALVADEDGTRVALVVDGKIKWQVVTVESDLGDRLSIAGGLKETDQVVTVPSTKLVDGLPVDIVAPPPVASAAPSGPAAAPPPGGAGASAGKTRP